MSWLLPSLKKRSQEGLWKILNKKIAFLLYTALYSRAGENWECGGVKLPGRVECTLWTTVWRHILRALGSRAMCLWSTACSVLPSCSWLLAVESWVANLSNCLGFSQNYCTFSVSIFPILETTQWPSIYYNPFPLLAVQKRTNTSWKDEFQHTHVL